MKIRAQKNRLNGVMAVWLSKRVSLSPLSPKDSKTIPKNVHSVQGKTPCRSTKNRRRISRRFLLTPFGDDRKIIPKNVTKFQKKIVSLRIFWNRLNKKFLLSPVIPRRRTSEAFVNSAYNRTPRAVTVSTSTAAWKKRPAKKPRRIFCAARRVSAFVSHARFRDDSKIICAECQKIKQKRAFCKINSRTCASVGQREPTKKITKIEDKRKAARKFCAAWHLGSRYTFRNGTVNSLKQVG
jgi:hypothetical protein